MGQSLPSQPYAAPSNYGERIGNDQNSRKVVFEAHKQMFQEQIEVQLHFLFFFTSSLLVVRVLLVLYSYISFSFYDYDENPMSIPFSLSIFSVPPPYSGIVAENVEVYNYFSQLGFYNHSVHNIKFLS